MIYVARQNLISTAHVDLNCGKNCEPRPPDWAFFSLLPSVLGVFWQCGAIESKKEQENGEELSLCMIKSDTRYWAFLWRGQFKKQHKPTWSKLHWERNTNSGTYSNLWHS